MYISLNKKVTKKNKETLKKIKEHNREIQAIERENLGRLERRDLLLQDLLDNKDVVFHSNYFLSIKNNDFNIYLDTNNAFMGFLLVTKINTVSEGYSVETAILKNAKHKKINMFIVVEDLITGRSPRNIITGNDETIQLKHAYKNVIELIHDNNYNQKELEGFLDICLDYKVDLSQDTVESAIINQQIKIKEIINKNIKDLKNVKNI